MVQSGSDLQSSLSCESLRSGGVVAAASLSLPSVLLWWLLRFGRRHHLLLLDPGSRANDDEGGYRSRRMVAGSGSKRDGANEVATGLWMGFGGPVDGLSGPVHAFFLFLFFYFDLPRRAGKPPR